MDNATKVAEIAAAVGTVARSGAPWFEFAPSQSDSIGQAVKNGFLIAVGERHVQLSFEGAALCYEKDPEESVRLRLQIKTECAERPVFDFKAIVDANFADGSGVLTFGKDTPDEVILAGIKQRLASGKAFTVVPA